MRWGFPDKKCVTANEKLKFFNCVSFIGTMCSSWQLVCCLADIYFEIRDGQCWSKQIFRKGSGLFCRTGLRSCNFWKRAEPPMLTGNVCWSQCIHMASTNKQYNTISTLWLCRKRAYKKRKRKESYTVQNRLKGRESRQMELVPQKIHFYKLHKERREFLSHRHTFTNKYICLNSNICTLLLDCTILMEDLLVCELR